MWVGTWNVGGLRVRGVEVCEELRKRMIYVCCLQEMRWRGQDAGMLGMKRRYRLCWSGKGDRFGIVGVTVKEEMCEEVVEVRNVSGGVMTVVVFEGDVLRLICVYAPERGRCLEEKQSFYDELKCE